MTVSFDGSYLLTMIFGPILGFEDGVVSFFFFSSGFSSGGSGLWCIVGDWWLRSEINDSISKEFSESSDEDVSDTLLGAELPGFKSEMPEISSWSRIGILIFLDETVFVDSDLSVYFDGTLVSI